MLGIISQTNCPDLGCLSHTIIIGQLWNWKDMILIEFGKGVKSFW